MDQNSLALALAGRRRRTAAGLRMLEETDQRLGCLANRLRLAEQERVVTQTRTGHRLTIEGRRPVVIPNAEASRTTPPVDAIPVGDEWTRPEPWRQSA